MLHRRRQIMVEDVDESQKIHRGSGVMPVIPGQPTMLVACNHGIAAKVMIESVDYDDHLIIDVYLLDQYDNTVWCEQDAINPLGEGRIFDCGQDIAGVVVECWISDFWSWLWSRFFNRQRSLRVEILE